jgi:hypothetical protein
MIQIVIILVILLGGGGFGAWTYMQKLQADNQVLQINQEVLKENELKLNDAIAEQQAVIAAKKLGRHELDVLAQNKPGLVVRVINRASDNALRCFEVLTGAPLTPDEEAADKPSLYNRECPTIHPKYGKEES